MRRSPAAFADLNLDQSLSLLGLETPRTPQDPVPWPMLVKQFEQATHNGQPAIVKREARSRSPRLDTIPEMGVLRDCPAEPKTSSSRLEEPWHVNGFELHIQRGGNSDHHRCESVSLNGR